uniref:DUF2808 domain-containing protein n=1 Tax=Oscillatoriales cyanobacterium SpSt-402 TaxID=2282168 RepID=A0A832H4T4_9CYAN
MKRQLCAIGLTAASVIGGFAVMQPAMALGETENNNARAQNITGYSRTTGNEITGKVSKDAEFVSKDDSVDLFAVTLQPGKTLTIQSINHPNNVVMQLIRDNNNSFTSDRGDLISSFVGSSPTSIKAPSGFPNGPVTYLIKVSMQDPRGVVPATNYGFKWFVR